VDYAALSAGNTRWLNTRFSRWARAALTSRAAARTGLLRRALGGFVPEAVLTVAHGFSWLTAARLAEESGLPLHLIVHDDYPTTTPVLSGLGTWQERTFARVYRQAVSRFCVSPFMEEEYRQRYGVAGQVLYPSRARQNPASDQVPATYARTKGPLIGAYAGNIVDPEYASLIVALAKRLDVRGGKLLLFCPLSGDELSALGLNRSNILPQGLVDSDQMIRRLRDEADFLYVPMAFDSASIQSNMRLSFPSKLTDYTATGLPIVICGPASCSAVRWARDYSPVAEVITSVEPADFDASLNRLDLPSCRESLGRAALAVGTRLFSHQAAFEMLRAALLSANQADFR
jgi:hypothetical protein